MPTPSDTKKDSVWSTSMNESVQRLNNTVCEKINPFRPENQDNLIWVKETSEECDFTTICQNADENKRDSDSHSTLLQETLNDTEDDESNDVSP